MKKLAVLAIVAILVIAVGASYQLSANLVKSSDVVKMGYIPLALSLPVYVAQEKNFFEAEGIRYELVRMDSTDSIIQGLVNNEIDAAFEVSLAPVLSFEGKNPNSIKIFSVSDLVSSKPFDSIVVKSGSKLFSLKDLEGKKLGIFPGQTGKTLTTLFKAFLKSRDIDSDSITFVGLVPDGQISALDKGNVDAVLTFEPTITQAAKQIGARRLYGSFLAEQISHNPQGAAIFTAEFVKDNPELAKKIVNVFDRSVDLMKTNEAGTRQLLTKWLPGLDSDVAKEMTLFQMVKNSDVDKSKVQEYADLLKSLGELDRSLDANSLVYSKS